MKKLFIFSLLFGLFLQGSPAQTYTPFPDSNAVWNVLETISYYTDSAKYNTVHYALFGDTVINATSYSKLFYNDGVIDSTILLASTNTKYHGALRQEILAKKIFFLPKDSVEEILLYDFNLNIGDTFFIPIQQFSWTNILLCMYKDSILINNLYRKTYHMWHPLSLTWSKWIEGIGSNKGLLYDFNNIEANHKLLCFYANDTLTYRLDSNTDFPSAPYYNYFYYYGCYYDSTLTITTSLINLKENNDAEIYPNPLTQSTTISIPESFQLNNIIIAVFDLQGRKIKEFQNISSHQINLYRADFRSGGVYFVHMKSDAYLKTFKLVVQ